MKKLFALLLAFCLLLSLPACGGRSKTAVGTWNSKLDLKNLVGDRLDEILDYLESTDVEVTLVMKEDKTFTMTLDGNGVASAVKKAATAFFADLLDSLGITQAQYEEITGKSLEATIEEAAGKIDAGILSGTVSGTYRDEKGSLILTAKGFSAKGSYEGDLLSLNASGAGKMTFTRG